MAIQSMDEWRKKKTVNKVQPYLGESKKRTSMDQVSNREEYRQYRATVGSNYKRVDRNEIQARRIKEIETKRSLQVEPLEKIEKIGKFGSTVAKMGEATTGMLSGIGRGIEAKGMALQTGSQKANLLQKASMPLSQKYNDTLAKIGIVDKANKFVGKGLEKYGKEFAEMEDKSSKYWGERVDPKYANMRGEDGKLSLSKMVNPINIVHQISSGVGSMLPMMVNPLGGALAMGVAEKGDAFQTYRKELAEQKGISVDELSDDDIKNLDEKSDYYGAISSGLEAIVPLKILKKIGGKKVATTFAKKLFQKVPIAMLKNGINEGGTEFLQSFTQNAIGEFAEFSEGKSLTEGSIDEFLAGFYTGMFMGAGEAQIENKTGTVTPQFDGQIITPSKDDTNKPTIQFDKDGKKQVILHFDQEKAIKGVTEKMEKELSNDQTEEFKKKVDGKTFESKEELKKIVDEIVYPKEKTFTEEEYDNYQFKKALKAIEEGKSNQAVIIAKDLPIKEKKKVVGLLEDMLKNADKEAKPIIKEHLETFKVKIEDEKLVNKDKIPAYENNKEFEKDNEYVGKDEDYIAQKEAEVKAQGVERMKKLDKEKKQLLDEKRASEEKKRVQKEIDDLDKKRIEIKENTKAEKKKVLVARGKKIQETVDNIKKIDKSFKLSEHNDWSSEEFEKHLKKVSEKISDKKNTTKEMKSSEIRDKLNETQKLLNETEGEERQKAIDAKNELLDQFNEFNEENHEVVVSVAGTGAIDTAKIKIVENDDGKFAESHSAYLSKSGMGYPFDGAYDTKEEAIKEAVDDIDNFFENAREEELTAKDESQIKKVKKEFEKLGFTDKRKDVIKKEKKAITTKPKKDERDKSEAVPNTSDIQPKPDLGSSEEVEKERPEHDGGNVSTEPRDGSSTDRPDGLTKKQRQVVNEKVEIILKSNEYSQNPDDYTVEDKVLMAKYSGAGGKESVGATGKGLLNEYYTPKVVINKMWGLARQYNPTQETAFEPSAGIGDIIAEAPNSVSIDGAELSKVSGTIANVLNPDSNISIGDFQELFFDPKTNKKKDYKTYDTVIGNPPFGARAGFLKGKGEEEKIGRMEEYFIKRGLDMTKDGGILIYVVNSSFLKTGNSKGKEAIAKIGTLIDAYRLPENSFADTSIGTDIVIFRKEKPKGEQDLYLRESMLVGDINFGSSVKPDKILGEIKKRTNRFGKEETYVEGDINEAMGKVETKEVKQVTKKPTVAKKSTVKKTKKAPKKYKQKARKGGDSLIMPKKNAEKLVNKSQNISNLSKDNYKKSAEMLKKIDRDLSVKSPTEEEKKELNYDGYGYFPDAVYYSGDIYKKIKQLKRNKTDALIAIGEERYKKQLEKLEKIKPERVKLADISIDPLDRHIGEMKYKDKHGQEPTIKSSFLSSIGGYMEKRPVLSPRVELYYVKRYVAGETAPKNTKRLTGLIKADAKRLYENFVKRDLPKKVQDKIEEKYNSEKNSYVKPDYSLIPVEIKDMAKKFKGTNFKMSQTQKEGVGFLVNKGSGVLAYGVGVGKTHSLAIATKANMDKGWTKRPFFAVPKATITDTWIKTLHEMFPTLKINNLGGLQSPIVKKLKKERGEDVKNWIRDGEFTVISHDGLLRLGFDQNEIIEGTKDIEDAIFKEDTTKTTLREGETKQDKYKEVVGRAQKFATDIMMSDLGIDHISVDEVHNFRKVFQGAKIEKDKNGVENAKKRFANIIGGTPSKRAQQLFLITQFIQKRNNNRNVFLASATPFENQATEVYNILSLIARDRLKAMGILNINDFFSSYANFEVELDRRLDGEWINREKMKSFANFDSLRSLIREFMDFQEDPTLVRPEKKVFTPHLQMSEKQEDNLEKIQELLHGNPVEGIEKKEGAFLKASTYSIANSISPYFIKEFTDGTPTAKEIVSQSPKLEYALEVAKAVRDDKKTKKSGIFMFLGKMGVEYHPALAEHFAEELGYKSEEVAYISGKVTDAQKEVIKKDFNSGKIKVLLGGDQTKEGIDLQMNGFVTLNLALGWNPSQITQVGGRVWRQGNRKNFVLELFPLVENSGDAMIYSKFEEKSGRINQIAYASGKTLDVGEVDATEKKMALITNPADKVKLQIEMDKTKLDNERIMIEEDISNVESLKEKFDVASNSLDYQKRDLNSEYNSKEQKKKIKKELSKLKKQVERFANSLSKFEGGSEKELSILNKKLEDTEKKISKIEETEPILLKKFTKEHNEQIKKRKSIKEHVSEIADTFKDLSEYTDKQLAEMKNKKIEELEKERGNNPSFIGDKTELVSGQELKDGSMGDDYKRSPRKKKEEFDFEGKKDYRIRKDLISGEQAVEETKKMLKRLRVTEADIRLVDQIFRDKKKGTAMASSYGDQIAFTKQVRKYTAGHEVMHSMRKNPEKFSELVEKGVTTDGLNAEIEEKYGLINEKEQDEKLSQLFEIFLDREENKGMIDESVSKITAGLEKPTGMIKKFFEGIYEWFKRISKKNPEINKSQIEIMFDFVHEGKGKEDVQFKKQKVRPALYVRNKEEVLDFYDVQDAYEKQQDRKEQIKNGVLLPSAIRKDFVGKSGQLQVAKLYKESYQKMYGEELKIFKEIENADLITKGTKKAFSEGKRVQKQASRSRYTARAWRVKRAFKREKEAIMRKFDKKEDRRKQLRQALEQIVSDLPVEMKRTILSQKIVFDIKGRKTFSEILDRVEKFKVKAEKQKMLQMAHKNVAKLIRMNDLQKTNNLRKALKFPRLSKMSLEQTNKFAEALEEARFGDIFLSQRTLELIDRTDLTGIKTFREGREALAKETGSTVEEVSNIKIKELDWLRSDTSLARRDPFLNLLVQRVSESMFAQESEYLQVEEITTDLMRKARNSRKRSLLQRLIPTDKLIYDYLESDKKEDIAKEMTIEELEVAEYIKEQFATMRDYLAEQKVLKTSIKDYITHMRRGFLETLVDDGSKTAIKEMFKQQEQDEAVFDIIPETGKILATEKFFKFALPRNGKMKPTQNVAKAFLSYKKAFHTKVALDSVTPKLVAFVAILQSDKKETEGGLVMDTKLEEFFKAWMNNKKGRKYKFMRIEQGSKVDIAIIALRSFLAMKDLGFNFTVQFASPLGEGAMNYTMIGAKKQALGMKRRATKKGKAIINNYRNFVGKKAVQEMFEPQDDIVDVAKKAMFFGFRLASISGNKTFLLGSITEEELESGVISDKRLAELETARGEYRVSEKGGSIIGSTSIGGSATQYKKWALPALSSTIRNIDTLKKTKDLKSKESQQLFRSIVGTTFLALVVLVLTADDDEYPEGFFGKLKQKMLRELLSFMGAWQLVTHPFDNIRSIQFLSDIGDIIDELIPQVRKRGDIKRLEQAKYEANKKGEYKKGDLKAPRHLKRLLEPGASRQFK